MWNSGLDSDVVFERIAVDSVADAVVNQIEGLIVAGVLRSGQKIPSERELAEQMDVSRPKLRDAIKTLEDRGLLHSRHGEGTYVAELTGAALSPAMVALFSRHQSAFRDYLEFRREVEGYAAYLAAQRATDSDREIVRLLLTRMVDAHERKDTSAEAETDAAFHSAIVDATHNSVLTHMMSSIYELMRRGVFYNREFLNSGGDSRDVLLSQHKEIGKAILEGDPEGASAAVEEHLDYVIDGFELGKAASARSRIAQKRLSAMTQTKPRRRERAVKNNGRSHAN